MKEKYKKVLRVAFKSANILAILCYLLACSVPFLSAGKFPFIALLGLIFPLLLFILFCFFIYWLFRRSKWALVCFAVLLLGWQQVTVMFGFNRSKKFEVSKTPQTLRVLSWNLSSWGQTNRQKKNNNLNEMVALIKSSNADVLCLQEFLYFKDFKYQDTIITALEEMGYQYSFFAKREYKKQVFPELILTGIKIMSKYPIINSAKFIYDENDVTEPLIYADIKINNDTARIFTTHLQSVRFGSYDYNALQYLKHPSAASIKQSRATGGKLKQAYKRRSLQTEFLQEKIKESPYPAIVCGDFNDVPNSYTYFTIKGNLQDAFLKKGSGFGRTFRFISPTLRIDYILADKKFEVVQFSELKVNYSDHYPVVADFEIKPEDK